MEERGRVSSISISSLSKSISASRVTNVYTFYVYLDVKGRGSSSDVADVESLKYDGMLNSLASRSFLYYGYL